MSLITLPGLIDSHVHLRDPGQTHKEDFYTGTAAALAGGFTTVLDMPNNKTPITTLARLKEKMKIAKEKIVCDVGFYFGSLGNNVEEFSKVKPLVKGLKLYLNETTGNFLIDKKTLTRIFDVWEGSPILTHAEDDAVAEVIQNVKRTGKRAHFCHISTAQDLQQIISAKQNNAPISCGVTPHHLFLTEQDAKKLGPFGRMKPPLRSKKDQSFLWKHLKYIDCIESDHAPHTISEKRGVILGGDLDERVERMFESRARRGRSSDASEDESLSKLQYLSPPYGVSGLETTLPLLLTAVSEKQLTIEDIIRLCHTGPGKIFHLPQFYSSNNQTKVEVDLDAIWTIEEKNLQTKCAWSPFEGWKIRGKVKRVFLRGKKVFENGVIRIQSGFGKILSNLN